MEIGVVGSVLCFMILIGLIMGGVLQYIVPCIMMAGALVFFLKLAGTK